MSINIPQQVKNVVRKVTQLWGTEKQKQELWDKEYQPGGKWDNCYGPTTFNELYDLMDKHLKGGKLLDLGCGTGGTSREFPPRMHSKYVGVDISSVALDFARQESAKLNLPNQEFVQSDFLSYVNETNEVFDVILSRESWYYFPNPVKALVDCCKILSDQGVFIISFHRRNVKKYNQLLQKLVTAPNFKRLWGLTDPDDQWVVLVLAKTCKYTD